ncbi:MULTISPECIES: hypothetical protein [unclassified Streptomyces]|uniref:hypothetical protein n=1 Tax=unclassified Streptomyces TaxID=2593676 RepID=UPI002DD957F5|nr:hypothetical protein [Streptomyces sp. NBC_01788]WSB27881.1 hypothetical protein OIE49_19445 [Streptomyces sp. NBC_01788]
MIAIPSVLVAVFFATSGAAAITRGWALPWNRRLVRRVRLYGWGQLVVAFAFCLQVIVGLVSSDPDIRLLSFGPLALTGLIVMMVSHTGRHRQGSGMP